MVATVRPETLEAGDIFFLYRPRVDTPEVHDRADVQRHYVVLAAKWPARIYRMLVVGRKKLPTLTIGQDPERRNWALTVRVSRNPDDIHRELAALEYDTKTRGRRFVPAAKPVGEGRYQLLRHRGHTELAYALELPKVPGPAQRELEIHEAGSFILAVRNPAIHTPGAPAAPERPAYPDHLRDKFGKRRWIDAEPALLDYENSEVLLIAAHADHVEEELGVHIDTEDEQVATAEVIHDLHLSSARERVTPLVTGEFPDHEESREQADEVHRLAPGEGPTRAGQIGGRAAMREAPSAAAMTRLLAGVELPKRRAELVEHAQQYAFRVDNPDEAIEVLRSLPDRLYANMAEIMSALGEVR